jgi:hypothetical protein
VNGRHRLRGERPGISPGKAAPGVFGFDKEHFCPGQP